MAAREAIAGKDAATLARELLAMTDEQFRVAFKGSPMKRAKLRGLKRNAAIVLGNAGAAEDVEVLTRALDDAEPLVREHAAWLLERLKSGSRSPARVGRSAIVPLEHEAADRVRAAQCGHESSRKNR